MKRRTVRLALIPIILTLVPLAGTASTVPSEGGSWEANITNYVDGQDGEPSVAINPTDPDNVIVTYLETGGAAGALVYQQRVPRLQDEVIQTIQSCRYVVTHDGGRTWRMKFIPTTDLLMPNCADTYVLFDERGTAYIMAGNFNVAFPVLDEIRMVTSTDGGESWSAPSTVLRNSSNPGADPIGDIADAQIKEYIDRYWMAIDDSTGAIYITAVQTWIPPVGTATRIGPIVSSHDGGRTWSKPTLAAPVGSPHVAAAFGSVAVAYNDEDCTCVVFAISSDDGKTFERRNTSFSSDGSPQVVADQTDAGRFAVMTTAGPNVIARLTDDDGETWSAPTIISQPGEDEKFKPWISYSRRGVLGAGWRTQYADGTYDFWAAASRNGGVTWAPARRISTEFSQPQNPVWVGGDDTSDVQFGPDDTLYAVWGDWRTGDLDIFWGGFPTRGLH